MHHIVAVMDTSFTNLTLGSVAEIQTGPFGSQLHAADYVSVGVPSIMPNSIGLRLKVSEEKTEKITNDDAQRLNKYLVQSNDIIYSRRGDVEKCAFITPKENGWLCGTGCLRVRFTSNQVCPQFCAYYLSTDEIKGWVSGNAVGTTMPNLNTQILQRLPLALPPLAEQQAIAAVLSSLDDKIDLQFIDLVGGGTPKTSVPRYWGEEILWLSGGDIARNDKRFVFDAEKWITQDGLNNSSAKLLPQFSTVITARGTVGKYCLLGKQAAYSQTNYGILPKIENTFFFSFLLIDYIMSELKMAAYGSVFDTITTSTFEEIFIYAPRENEIKEFDAKISEYFMKIFQNQIQISTLTKLRDTLLPKLMSGDVRVKA